MGESLLSVLDESRREEIEREARRMELMQQIAGYRWTIAQQHHRLENGEPMDFTRYPYQQTIYEDPSMEMVVMGSTQWGKCGGVDTLIHTPSGWRKLGDIQVGDMVSTPFDTSARVLGVYPQGVKDLYRVTMSDGRSCEAGAEHLWEVFRGGAAEIITTQQVQEALAAGHRLAVVVPQPVPMVRQELPVEPYLLGQSGCLCIPQAYLRGSIEQRQALLQGLLSTQAGPSFVSASRQLALDVQELVRSLGGLASMSEQAGTYVVSFPRADRLYITGVEYTRKAEAQCIYIDHPRHLYLAENYCPTHNTEFLITTAAAMAACGLRVLYCLSKLDKLFKMVGSRITPVFREVPLYAAMLKAAKNRSAEVDSARFKHFGPGSINFVGSNSEKDFTSYSADAAIIDEHQECVLENVSRVDSRMSGSPWRYKIIVGNPRIIGTDENQNLDWEYQNTDRRQWQVPCEYCGTYQVLGWWSHFIKEEKNKQGGILAIAPRDEDWSLEAFPLDLRAICTNCHRPMNRLSRQGRWVAQNPGHPRHGYQLSNLYNINVRMDALLTRYRTALHDPGKMADFVNDQLGLAWAMEGSSITARMLDQCSTGDLAGVQPYRFLPVSQLLWEVAA